MAEEFYWCTRHERVESGSGRCASTFLLGPYDSAEAAGNYAETVEARNEKWDRDDERWERGRG